MTTGRASVLAALFLGALALRPQLVGIGPLFPEVQRDLATSHAVVGLLGTIPVLCMGLFAPPAAYLMGWIGSRTAVAGCLGLIALFGTARALAPSAALVIALTVPVGIGMGVAGALLPVAVKERFSDRPAFATGVYTSGIQLGSALSAATAVPLAGAAGGWRGPLLVFSAVTGLLVAAWLGLTRRQQRERGSPRRPLRLPWGSGVAWLLALLFGLMGVVYYGINSWLPDSYVERGWSEGSAGALLAVLNIAGLPASLLVPWLADRHGSRRTYLVALAAFLAVGLAALVLVPAGGYAWAALVGLAIGALFPLVLTLPLDVGRNAAEVGAIAGLMLGAGYVLAALAPFALGAARDATGSFTTTLWTIVGAALVLLVVALPLTGERLSPAAKAGFVD